jgi:cardiolipin synthase (CMP-forming)
MTFTIPNLLSLFRMGLVPLFIIAMVDGDPRKALAFFMAAGITDALDGFIARFWHQQSPLGAYLDPIADKLLLTAAYVVLSIPALNQGVPVPLWLTILVIARDLLIVVMALALYLAVGIHRFPPSTLGKLTTVAQVVTIVLVLVSNAFPGWGYVDAVAETLLYVVAFLTVASGLGYVFRGPWMEHSGTKPA